MWILENVSKELAILLDVVIAALLSAAIGAERESFHKPAGLRTNMIVGSISCFFVSISSVLSNYVDSATAEGTISTDPIRVMHAIIVGVSFIGAGTILKSSAENTVYYLTTAATLLFSTGIGISVALGFYVLAVGLTVVVVLINLLNNIRIIKSGNEDKGADRRNNDL